MRDALDLPLTLPAELAPRRRGALGAARCEAPSTCRTQQHGSGWPPVSLSRWAARRDLPVFPDTARAA
jgi:hypothetical protein